MILYIALMLVFAFLGGIHFYWAFGGSWGVEATFPILDNGPKDFKPPLVATIIVGLGLWSMALFYLLILLSFHSIIFDSSSKYVQWIIPSIFTLRAIGDFKYIGLFKTRRQSSFAEMDTKLFSPLCLFIAVAGLLLALNIF